ncbi:hypothetical protein DSECCO2_549490 [anaerobic digester metagenome]
MGGVLLGRGVPVAKVPGPRSHVAGALIGELDGERDVALGAVQGKGCRWALQNGDIVGPDLVATPAGVGCGQVDGVDARCFVDIDRILPGRDTTIAEIPEPGEWMVSGSIVELDGQRRVAPGHVHGEVCNRRRACYRDVVGQEFSITSASVGCSQANGVVPWSCISMGWMLLRGSGGLHPPDIVPAAAHENNATVR